MTITKFSSVHTPAYTVLATSMQDAVFFQFFHLHTRMTGPSSNIHVYNSLHVF